MFMRIKNWLLMVVAVCFALQARAAAPTIPVTPAAKALGVYRAAHEPELSVERELAFRQMLSRFELLEVAGNEPHPPSAESLVEYYGNRMRIAAQITTQEGASP